METRKIGGSSERKQLEKLMPKIYEIDHFIGKILGLDTEYIQNIEKTVEILIDRRVSEARETNPESIKGEVEEKIKSPKKKREKNESPSSLDRFIY